MIIPFYYSNYFHLIFKYYLKHYNDYFIFNSFYVNYFLYIKQLILFLLIKGQILFL